MYNWSKYESFANVLELKKNTILYRQGDKINGFYYVHKGKIAISLLREDGYERIIDFVFPGSLTGELILNSNAATTTATLLTDSTLYYFSKDQFELLSKKYPDTLYQVNYSLIKKIRFLTNINLILKAPVAVQLAHFFLTLYERTQNRDIELSQTTISKYIGKSRVAIWKVMKEWKKEGIIEVNNNKIRIKQLKRLREIV